MMTLPKPRPIACLSCEHHRDRLPDDVLGGNAYCDEGGHPGGNYTIQTFAIIDQERIERARTMRETEERLHPDAVRGAICNDTKCPVHGPALRRVSDRLTEADKLADLFQPKEAKP